MADQWKWVDDMIASQRGLDTLLYLRTDDLAALLAAAREGGRLRMLLERALDPLDYMVRHWSRKLMEDERSLPDEIRAALAGKGGG